MHERLRLTGLAMVVVAAAVAAECPAAWAADFPQWAYPTCQRPPVAAAPGAVPNATRILSVPGSTVHATVADVRNWSVTVDWFPSEHAPLPPILAASHTPSKAACGFCHLPDGSGRPENAKVAGLPAPYIIAQVKALHAGVRAAAVKDWAPTVLMREATAELPDREIAAAAAYFSRQSVKSFVRLEQGGMAPAHAPACFIQVAAPGAAVPVGDTIVEMPADMSRFEARDPHTPYVAYVPVGSVERGRRLAASGDHGRTQSCAVCHGPEFKGGANLPGPPLAGRFATYLFRQLYGFQSGARGGDAALPMQGVVARLTQADMVDLAAYAASLDP